MSVPTCAIARSPLGDSFTIAAGGACGGVGPGSTGGIGPVTLRIGFTSVPSQRNDTRPSLKLYA
jgi:hypothetical protein